MLKVLRFPKRVSKNSFPLSSRSLAVACRMHSCILVFLYLSFMLEIAPGLVRCTPPVVSSTPYVTLFAKCSGSWCRREFVSATRPSFARVGWSGILDRNLSSLVLKMSTLLAVIFRISHGSKLKIFAPFMARLFSRALCTFNGQFLWTGLMLHNRPLLPCSLEKSSEYPSLIFIASMVIKKKLPEMAENH